MEDSLEDYLRISRNAKGKKKKESEQEAMKNYALTLQKKKESEARAMKIVEFMIEGRLRVETFLRCLLHINPEYYQDIVEERALNKLCGYGLCSQKLPEMPKKKYHISSKQNKIYDITDRKNYCSNFCYKASLHIKKQIETSPLWLRDSDEVPNFKLLSPSSGGLLGEEIDQGIAKPVEDIQFTSVWSFTDASLDELAKNEVKRKQSSKHLQKSTMNSEMNTIKENDENEDEGDAGSNSLKGSESEGGNSESNTVTGENNQLVDDKISEHSVINRRGQTLGSSQSSNENKESISIDVSENIKNAKETVPPKKKSVFAEKRKTQKSASSNSTISQINQGIQNVLDYVKKCVYEWVSIETYMFLYGEEKLRRILSEKQMSDLLNSVKLSEEKTSRQMKYFELCKKLQLKEMAEEIFDKTVIGKNLKPLPDYEKLKQESKTMDLKVRSFYKGIPYELEAEPASEGKGTKSGNNSKEHKGSVEEVDSKEEEAPPAVLPLADVNSQNALRRKVFLNSLNKSLQNLAELFQISMYKVQLDVQGLVKTFRLQANNVMFKPLVWNIIAIFILKILSIKDSYLKEQMENTKTQHHIKQILKPFPEAAVFLDNLLIKIEDVETFICNYLKD